nr:hypothetical protein GCM10020092_070380 [Actinoplanes digitatis]
MFGRARSMQRRRRVGAGVAGAATLGVLLVVAVAARPGPAAGPDPEGGVAPAAPAPSTGAPSPGTPATVLETLRTLLPPGAKTRDHESDDGFAGLVITDPARPHHRGGQRPAALHRVGQGLRGAAARPLRLCEEDGS